MRILMRRTESPILSFRLVFLAGSAYDPAGQAGLASLTAAMLTESGTAKRPYEQILEEMFPMAARIRATVDREMTVVCGTVHRDCLDRFYALLREAVVEPGWREDDFERVRNDRLTAIRVTLRDNDEELGKVVLEADVFRRPPVCGIAGQVAQLTLEDARRYYASRFTRDRLTIGLTGAFPKGFEERVERDFSILPASPWRVTLIDKPSRAYAISIGFPIAVRRGHPDFPALKLATSCLGEHRTSSGRLFDRIRQVRGINYGDYAYIEHFPHGMFCFHPETNLVRSEQMFQIWIRPVEMAQAHFALRLAVYELERFIREGIAAEEFERSRAFLSKYVDLEMQTADAQLGYALDSDYYGIPSYPEYLRAAFARMTRDDVNAAIRRHLHADGLHIAVVGPNAAEFRDALIAGAPSPMAYNSPKSEDVLAQDRIVERLPLPIRPEHCRVVAVGQAFE